MNRLARDIIESLEEDSVDPRSVRVSVLRDLKLMGLSEVQVVVDEYSLKLESAFNSDRNTLMQICDVYSRTYPEIEFLVGNPQLR